ncbi:hypothetical protein DO659_26055 [Salmonella enterica subsp. enterica serovar Minnesota]|nr:hypothetical protein [Salmonella enterica subsp. enterica serovar Minnesota]ECI4647372.1 hypothetical protein [Salmonella enterica subsp. salamae]
MYLKVTTISRVLRLLHTQVAFLGRCIRYLHWVPRYLILTPYNGVLASQTRHDYCPQSTMIRGGMSPGLVGRL